MAKRLDVTVAGMTEMVQLNPFLLFSYFCSSTFNVYCELSSE